MTVKESTAPTPQNPCWYNFFKKNDDTQPSVSNKVAQTILDLDKETKTIFTKTVEHNAKQISNLENIQKAESKNIIKKFLPTIAVFVFYAGIAAFFVGIGSLLPVHGQITGIPMWASILIVTSGAILSSMLPSLYVVSKIFPNGKAAQFFKAFLRKDGDLFLGSNLNDLLFVATLIIILAHFNSPVLEKALNWSTGALFIASGLYQLKESLIELKSALQAKDKEKLLRQFANITNSLILILIGVTACPGLYDKKWVISLNLVNGAISLGLAAYLFFKYSLPNILKLSKIDPTDANQIWNYLQETLNISKKDENGIKAKYSAYSKESIIKWIKQNSKNFNTVQKARWEKTKKHLSEIKETQLNKEESINLENSLKEITALIIKEEIKNQSDNKIETFRGLVNQKTYKEILEVLKNPELTKDGANKLKAIFSQIKKDIYIKIVGEIGKVGMNAGFMMVPMLNRMNVLSTSSYYIGMIAFTLLSLGINIWPRLRNIPPTMEKDFLDINKQLNDPQNTASPSYLKNINRDLHFLTPETIKKAKKAAQKILAA